MVCFSCLLRSSRGWARRSWGRPSAADTLCVSLGGAGKGGESRAATIVCFAHESGLAFGGSRITSHAVLIGTRERLETCVSYRKQTGGYTSNRYSSHRRSAKYPSSSLQPLASNHQNLPDTPERVETCVSCRKQTIAPSSTRHASRSPLVRFPAPHARRKFRLHSGRACPRIGSQSRPGKGGLKNSVNH
jgi:hypothetical protein